MKKNKNPCFIFLSQIDPCQKQRRCPPLYEWVNHYCSSCASIMSPPQKYHNCAIIIICFYLCKGTQVDPYCSLVILQIQTHLSTWGSLVSCFWIFCYYELNSNVLRVSYWARVLTFLSNKWMEWMPRLQCFWCVSLKTLHQIHDMIDEHVQLYNSNEWQLKKRTPWRYVKVTLADKDSLIQLGLFQGA